MKVFGPLVTMGIVHFTKLCPKGKNPFCYSINYSVMYAGGSSVNEIYVIAPSVNKANTTSLCLKKNYLENLKEFLATKNYSNLLSSPPSPPTLEW
jgi:hypothetical protein